ncbi:hypothetical protein [Streptomyces venezuelae]|uniref:hypothetical protein n=1 Tax=Streptomyces venezuelae TaxID=54571 RepID=UPI00365566C0
MRISAFAKSLVAGVAAGSAAAVAATQDGTLVTGEVVTIVLAVLGAWGITYAVPNKPSSPSIGPVT